MILIIYDSQEQQITKFYLAINFFLNITLPLSKKIAFKAIQ